ncbi:MAG: hypothetical protein NTZ44_01925 [Candidatus Nomurabacteria bacterium]|nr:hypothetical protein [Candidatus Nomurabacteria bacterium]
MKKILITFIVIVSIFSITQKASAVLFFCPPLMDLSTSPQQTERIQIQIQGIATTDNIPLPIGTTINYSALPLNFSACGNSDKGTNGSFTINKANGQYGPTSISVPLNTPYLSLALYSIPKDYLAGRVIQGDSSMQFTITPSMANTTITQNLAFKAKLIVPPPIPPPLPPLPSFPEEPLYPKLGETLPPPMDDTAKIEICRNANSRFDKFDNRCTYCPIDFVVSKTGTNCIKSTGDEYLKVVEIETPVKTKTPVIKKEIKNTEVVAPIVSIANTPPMQKLSWWRRFINWIKN